MRTTFPTRDALRQMGTNSLRPLLRMVGAKDSALKRRVMSLLAKQSVVRWRGTPCSEYHRMAVDGFALLGPAGQPALPALIELLGDRDTEVRQCAAACLGSFGPAGEEAVPTLLQHLKDPDTQVRENAEMSLGLIHKRPELVVPALTKRLEGATKKLGPLFALGCFGPEAKSAVPVILPLLNDPNEETRTWAAMSLKRIDAEAAAEAGVK